MNEKELINHINKESTKNFCEVFESLEDRFGNADNYNTETYGHYSISARSSENNRIYLRWVGDKNHPIEVRTHNHGIAFRMFEVLSEEVVKRYGDKYQTLAESMPPELWNRVKG